MSQCCDAVEHRYELVPKKVKEDEFWRNYFYRVGLAKQSFELAPVAPITSTAAAKPTNSNASANRWRITNSSELFQFLRVLNNDRSMDEVEDGGGEQEEEFLSEQQEVLKLPLN